MPIPTVGVISQSSACDVIWRIDHLSQKLRILPFFKFGTAPAKLFSSSGVAPPDTKQTNRRLQNVRYRNQQRRPRSCILTDHFCRSVRHSDHPSQPNSLRLTAPTHPKEFNHVRRRQQHHDPRSRPLRRYLSRLVRRRDRSSQPRFVCLRAVYMNTDR